MVKIQKNASVIQILFISYLMVTLPAILFACYLIKSVNDELILHVAFIESGKLDIDVKEPDALLSFGAFLRAHSAPFSRLDEDTYDATGPAQNWTESLRNARVAIIYCWILLLFFGALVYFFVVINLQRLFQRLVTAIDSLRKHNLTKEIRLEGPFDLSEVSASLESLRQKMSHEEVQQQRFLSHISHEIKTPLTSIKEGSKLLDEQALGQINSEQQEITNILVRSSADLQRAIESLLDYNSAVALKKVRRRSSHDLADLARKALANNELLIKQKQLSIDARLNSCHGNIDQGQILTVFDNLISNAIKHSPTQGVIWITLQKKKAKEISFQIKDQGPGVASIDEKHIFEPFYVGAQTTGNTLKGTGLGLSIAKQYIDDHHGQLRLIKGQEGATFQVVLPVNQLEET